MPPGSVPVDLELRLLAQNAEKAAKDFAATTQRQLDSIDFKATVASIEAGFNIASKIFEVLKAGFDESVGQAIEFEQATTRLGKSMKLVGDFSEDAVAHFVEFANQMQSISGVSDDVILKALQLAKNFRLTNNEAELAAKAALGLSQATGDDLNSSIEKVSKTFNGVLNRDLAQLIPALKGLTTQQLAAGDAARILAERFPATFGGTTADNVQKLKNSFDDLAKTIGKVFLPQINESRQSLSKLLDDINEFISRDIDLARQFEGSGGIDAFAKKGQQAFVSKQLGFTDADNRRKAALSEIEFDKEQRVRADRERDAARIKAEEQFQSLKLELEKNGLDEVEKIEADSAKQRRIIEEAFRTGVIKNRKEEIVLLEKLEKESKKKIIEAEKELRDKQLAEFEKERKKGKFEDPLDVGGNIKGGALGAKNVVANGAGAVAEAFLPGLGKIVKEIVDVLAGGPDEVEKTIKAFIGGIPRIITNVIKSIPTLILGIIREIPKAIVEFLKDGIPEIIAEFIKQIPVIIEELIKYLPVVVSGLIKAFVEGTPKIIKSFIDELVKQASRFIDALVSAVTDVGSFLGDSGVGGAVGDVLDPFGFFGGGGIFASSAPGDAGGGGGGATADGGAGASTQTIVLRVDQRELARVVLDMNQRGRRLA